MRREPVPTKPSLYDCDDLNIAKEAIRKYNPCSHACERCGNLFWFIIQVGVYVRNIVYPCNGHPVCDTIEIPLMLCRNCGSSKDGRKFDSPDYWHAVIPTNLIPFTPYTLSFVLTVLDAYANRTCTVVELCAHWQIAVSTLYAWKKRYKEQYDAYVDSMDSIRKQEEDASSSGGEFVEIEKKVIASSLMALSEMMPTFVSDYFHRFTFSFMQPSKRTHFRELPIGRRIII